MQAAVHLPAHLCSHGVDVTSLPVRCCSDSCLPLLFRMRRAGAAGRALGLQLPAFAPTYWRLCMVQTWSFQVRSCLAPSDFCIATAVLWSPVTFCQGLQCDTGICLAGLQAHKVLLGLLSGCHQCEGRPWHRSSCSESTFVPAVCASVYYICSM